jgi:hypothetical protein
VRLPESFFPQAPFAQRRFIGADGIVSFAAFFGFDEDALAAANLRVQRGPALGNFCRAGY